MLRKFIVLLVTLLGAGGALVGLGASAQAATVPWGTDPSQKGYIGLCDVNGNNVTGGSITTRPFVLKAIASVPPPAAYLGSGQNAVLNMYQPRPETEPSDWSGQQMNAASFYKDSKYPTTVLTTGDLSIHDAMAMYPPQLNGLYQLRMFFGKANYGTYSENYPATTIQVTGSTWHVVQGGNVQCDKADATSLEVITGVISSQSAVPHSGAGPSGSASGSHASGSTSGRSGAGAATASASPSVSVNDGLHDPTGPAPSTAAAASQTSTGKSGSNNLWWIVIPIVAVVVIGGAFLARHRPRSNRSD
jgi:hypothetical protein